MKISHFYHVFAGGAWSEPVREHIRALGQSRFEGSMTVGLVGAPADRERAREMITLRLGGWGLPAPEAWAEADDGFEAVTLSALREHAIACEQPEAILYAHTKGAYSHHPANVPWRRSMTRYLVSGWRDCVKLLEDGYDTAGCHWLTREENHDPPDFLWPYSHYAGNFWWAQAGYLRQLPPLELDTRWQAEEWIGHGTPLAADLLPGRPLEMFTPAEAG